MKVIHYSSIVVGLLSVILYCLTTQLSPIYAVVSVVSVLVFWYTIPKEKRNAKLGKTKPVYPVIKYLLLFVMIFIPIEVTRNDYDRVSFKIIEIFLLVIYFVVALREWQYRVNTGKETEIESNK